AVADAVIVNDGSLAELKTRVDAVWAEVDARAATSSDDQS
ncbi:MAG: hypothetical protein QOF95_609, partial [Pseudonocardiales bacterium]|nr:hypothetical protein [Pseudonocardiales bacterium]